jgi:hypothetical protein
MRQNTIGQRIVRFAALLCVLFVIGLIFVVYHRLSEDTIALVVGIVLTLTVTTIFLAIFGFFGLLAVRAMEARSATRMPMYQQPAQPTVLMLPSGTQAQPQQLYGYGGNGHGYSRGLGDERQFTVIGDE